MKLKKKKENHPALYRHNGKNSILFYAPHVINSILYPSRKLKTREIKTKVLFTFSFFGKIRQNDINRWTKIVQNASKTKKNCPDGLQICGYVNQWISFDIFVEWVGGDVDIFNMLERVQVMIKIYAINNWYIYEIFINLPFRQHLICVPAVWLVP